MGVFAFFYFIARLSKRKENLKTIAKVHYCLNIDRLLLPFRIIFVSLCSIIVDTNKRLFF